MTTGSTRTDNTVRSFVCHVDPPVACNVELKLATEQIEHLEAALVNARRIGAAIGIIMTRMNLTEDQGFEVLREASQRRNRKLRQLADDVLYTGALE
ncbi:MAG: ANTAR domain-containing protein [Antricoccus sp.]